MPPDSATAAAATLDEIRKWPATVDIERAAAAFGFSRSWGYQLAASGDFPCKALRIRGRTRVVTASLVRVLEGGEP